MANPMRAPRDPQQQGRTNLRLALVLASVGDVSERRALEWAFRGVFDASPYGLAIVDDTGLIAMANAVLAQSLGYTTAQLVGQRVVGQLGGQRIDGLRALQRDQREQQAHAHQYTAFDHVHLVLPRTGGRVTARAGWAWSA